jgi:hypothetical protein
LPGKAIPIPPHVAATIGLYDPMEVRKIFVACAHSVLDASNKLAVDDVNCINWDEINSQLEAEAATSTDCARANMIILQFICWALMHDDCQIQFIDLELVEHCNNPNGLDWMSRIEQSYLDNNSRLPPLPPKNEAEGTLAALIASNFENGNKMRSLIAKLVKGQ